jgi:hypothetical protein
VTFSKSGGPARGCGLGQTSGCHLQGHLDDWRSKSLGERAAVNWTWLAPGANHHSNHGTGVHFQTWCVESIYESLLSARSKLSQSPHFKVEGTPSRLTLAFSGFQWLASGMWAACERQVKEFGLKKPFGSPNGAMRRRPKGRPKCVLIGFEERNIRPPRDPTCSKKM